MELFIFARFHAREGQETTVAAALRAVVAPTRTEPGCIAITAFRSLRDARLFYIHSRWQDEAAFERHALLAHTRHFLAQVEPAIDHPLDIARTRPLAVADGKEADAALLISGMQQAIDDPRWVADGPHNNPGAEAAIAQPLAAWREAGWLGFDVRHDSAEPNATYRSG